MEDDLPKASTPRFKRKAESNDGGGLSLVGQLGGGSNGSASESHSSNRQELAAVFQLPVGGDDDDDNDDRGAASETLVSNVDALTS